jgi:hypothetical protein
VDAAGGDAMPTVSFAGNPRADRLGMGHRASRRSRIVAASFAAFAGLQSQAPAFAVNGKVKPEAVVITSYDPSGIAWGRGSIAVVLKKNGGLAVGLDYSMPNGRLVSMTIRGTTWVVDVSKAVSNLDDPYPLRSQVWIYKMDARGNVDEMTLEMPFGGEGKQCRAIHFHLVKGKLTESGIGPAADMQCGQ